MISRFLILQDADVRQAMQQLESTERKTLCVIDVNEVLIGTVTDGDVRRWILGGGSLTGRIGAVCNPDPVVADITTSRDAMKRTMISRGINCIPIVDADRRVSDMVFLEELLSEGSPESTEKKSIGLPVVVMAGGLGTRLTPFTTVLPKPLIPVSGRTVIEIIMGAFTDYGVDNFYLTVNYKAKIIKAYFEELEPDYSVKFVQEDKPLGTAGSLRTLLGALSSDLIVTNCDVIVKADFYELSRHHAVEGNDITVVVSLKNYTIPYGVCEIDSSGVLKQIVEKPQFNYLVNTGLYVLKPGVLKHIPEDELFHFTDLIAAVQKAGGRVGVYPISDKAWLDTGEWAEYRSAVANLSADRRKASR